MNEIDGSKRFMNVNDVAQFFGISVSKSYKIIQSLNKELKAKGYITIAGKVPRAYLEDRVYKKQNIETQ